MIAPHLRKSAGKMSIHDDYEQSDECPPPKLVRAKAVMLQISVQSSDMLS